MIVCHVVLMNKIKKKFIDLMIKIADMQFMKF